METLQAILLGIVQGITEFLPVSSSGHLQIAKALLGVELEDNLLFDVTLHAATVLSTIVVLWSEVWRLLKGLFSRRFTSEQAYVLKIAVSMIPIGIVGFCFKDRIEAMLNAPWILALVGGIAAVDGSAARIRLLCPSPRKGTNLLPRCVHHRHRASRGTRCRLSRSGSTICAGLFRGFSRDFAVRFAFIMSLPVVFGANCWRSATQSRRLRFRAGSRFICTYWVSLWRWFPACWQSA